MYYIAGTTTYDDSIGSVSQPNIVWSLRNPPVSLILTHLVAPMASYFIILLCLTRDNFTHQTALAR
jgi:hypothetical protein